MFSVFSHLGTMTFQSPREATAFFWALERKIRREKVGWVGWDEFLVSPRKSICISRVVEDMRATRNT